MLRLLSLLPSYVFQRICLPPNFLRKANRNNPMHITMHINYQFSTDKADNGDTTSSVSQIDDNENGEGS